MLHSRAIAGVLICACLLIGNRAATAQNKPHLDIDRRLPINLEATSSQFDGVNNQLSFQNVLITQGVMSVRAERGTVARLDFENSRWQFEGNVVLESQGAKVSGDSAELQFVGHELRSAVLRGVPAQFEQPRPGDTLARGRARVMDYDVSTATIRLSGDAWLSDGANEVTGERISYDIVREYVTADSDGKGGIRMKIKPPQDREAVTKP
ncbi:MAG: LptA/OstA family protein [Gammaproteobacteria bacterium]|nr:MAG: LptA/OstA family protein [Gammaproteobacteria bacterium]